MRDFLFWLGYSSLPWPTLLDLDLQRYREDSTDQDDESEGDSVLEGELIGYGLDDIDCYEYLESEEDRSPYLFADMSVYVFPCILAIRTRGTIESHEYTTEYDTHTQYLDDGLHDDEYIVVVHKKSWYRYDNRIW